MSNIAVIGQGYVGLPLAIYVVDAGHNVVGIDTNELKVKKLNEGISDVEDVSNDALKQALKSNCYKTSNKYESIKDCDVVVICVPTPLNLKRESDLIQLEAACRSVSINMKNDVLVIVESTVAPGTTRKIVSNILKESGKPFFLAYSPERIDPRNTNWNIKNTPKLLAGLDKESLSRAKKFYDSFIENVVPYESIEVVETAKLLENSFRLINISFINEMADFCEKLGIDVNQVISAAATKPYGYMPFYPGVGVGGHCIPVDPVYLIEKAQELTSDMSLLKLAEKINHTNPERIVKKIEKRLGILNDKKILVVGIGYKSGISDLRESAALKLIYILKKRGAIVKWHDQLISEWNGETSEPVSNKFDLIVLANPSKEFEVENSLSEKVFDTRGKK
mgnify:CR=1 FL=1